MREQDEGIISKPDTIRHCLNSRKKNELNRKILLSNIRKLAQQACKKMLTK